MNRTSVAQRGERAFQPTTLFLLLFAWGGLWALTALGVFAPIDGRFFDLFSRAITTNAEVSVAIVRVPVGDARRVQEQLLERGFDGTVVPPLAVPHVAGPGVPVAEKVSAGCLPPVAEGVLRRWPLRDADGRPCPLAAAASIAGWAVPVASYVSPDFSLVTSTAVPQLDVRTLASDEAATILQDRAILIVEGDETPAYVTPLYASDGLLEPSVLHALLLDSMRRGTSIQWAPAWLTVLLAMLVVLVLHRGLRHARYRTMLLSAAIAIPVVILLHGVVMRTTQLFLPSFPACLALVAYALRMVFERQGAMQQILVDLELRLTGVVGERIANGLDVPQDVVWEQINRFLINYFDLRRSLILELPAGATHLRPVASFGCTASDIVEQRRDYRRSPYSNAIAQRLPTPPVRPFLPPMPGTVDLLAPLVAAEELVGLWGFSIAVPEGETAEVVAAEAGRYADEVAKIILRQTDAGERKRRGVGRWPVLANVRARLLDGASQASEQLAAFRDIFAAVAHPIAVCSLMGRVQITNPAMDAFLDALGHTSRSMSVTDMLEQLASATTASAKECMREVLLGGESRLPLSVPWRNLEGGAVLVLRPIARHAHAKDSPSASPFDLLGIIVEVLPKATELVRRSDAAVYRSEMGDLLQRVVRERAGVLQAKRIMLAVPAQALPATALPPMLLQQLLGDSLDLCIDDAVPDSEVRVEAHLLSRVSLQLIIQNQGFGMSSGHVADVMRAARPGALPRHATPLERLAHSAALLEGRLGFQVESELASGYRIELTLPVLS